MKNWVYQVLVHRTTNECYRNSLHHVPDGSRLLDVGIGNGIMLESLHPLIKAKKLRITGIDIDANYLKHCEELIRKHQLTDSIDVCHAAAEGYCPPQKGCFDTVLFNLSFMLLRDQRAVLQRARDWLKPGGQLIFAQAIFRKRSRLVDLVKPKLKYLTTIDFGRAIYEKDFFALLEETGLAIQVDRVLKGEWFNSQCRMIAASFQEAPLDRRCEPAALGAPAPRLDARNSDPPSPVILPIPQPRATGSQGRKPAGATSPVETGPERDGAGCSSLPSAQQ
ncbi:MAG: class I SAM-dependent methyltransferase [Planctomycetes bacterium]|nr:class I SAM-dependent methyltransferase [Planctomycetota bacterium]